MANEKSLQKAFDPEELGLGATLTSQYANHARELFQKILSESFRTTNRLVGFKTNLIPEFNTSETIAKKQATRLIKITLECCLKTGENFTLIKNSKDARSILREKSGLNDLEKFLYGIDALKLQKVLELSQTKKAISDIFKSPEGFQNDYLGDFQFLKDQVSDIRYWIDIVKRIYESGQMDLLKPFINEVKPRSLKQSLFVLQKNKVFMTMITWAMLGEVKNVFNIEDIRAIESIVKSDPNWHKILSVGFQKIFTDSNFSDIPFADIPFVASEINFLKKSYIPFHLRKKLVLDRTLNEKIKSLEKAHALYVRFTNEENGTYIFQKTRSAVLKLIGKNNCSIFKKVFAVEPTLFMYLDEHQIRRLVFTNKLHEFFEEETLLKIFKASDRLEDYEKAVHFTENLKPHEFAKELSKPENFSLLKDIGGYENDITLFKKMDTQISQEFRINDKMADSVLVKLVRLMNSSTLKPIDYSNLIIKSLHHDLLDESTMIFLFFVNKTEKIPGVVLKYAQEQEWYSIVNEGTKEYFRSRLKK